MARTPVRLQIKPVLAVKARVGRRDDLRRGGEHMRELRALLADVEAGAGRRDSGRGPTPEPRSSPHGRAGARVEPEPGVRDRPAGLVDEPGPVALRRHADGGDAIASDPASFPRARAGSSRNPPRSRPSTGRPRRRGASDSGSASRRRRAACRSRSKAIDLMTEVPASIADQDVLASAHFARRLMPPRPFPRPRLRAVGDRPRRVRVEDMELGAAESGSGSCRRDWRRPRRMRHGDEQLAGDVQRQMALVAEPLVRDDLRFVLAGAEPHVVRPDADDDASCAGRSRAAGPLADFRRRIIEPRAVGDVEDAGARRSSPRRRTRSSAARR